MVIRSWICFVFSFCLLWIVPQSSATVTEGFQDLLVLTCGTPTRPAALHVVPQHGLLHTAISIDVIKKFWIAFQETMLDDLQCNCPAMTWEDVNRHFGLQLVNFLYAIDGTHYDRPLEYFSYCGFNFSLTQLADHVNFTLPGTCSGANFTAGLPCQFQWAPAFLPRNTKLQVAFKQCSADPKDLPYISISCSGSLCGDLLRPCQSDADCVSTTPGVCGSLDELSTDDNERAIYSFLQQIQAVDSYTQNITCMGVAKNTASYAADMGRVVLNKAFQYVSNSLGLNFNPFSSAPLGICEKNLTMSIIQALSNTGSSTSSSSVPVDGGGTVSTVSGLMFRESLDPSILSDSPSFSLKHTEHSTLPHHNTGAQLLHTVKSMWSRFTRTLFTPGSRRREYHDMFKQNSFNGGGVGYPEWVFAQTDSRETRTLTSRQRGQSTLSVRDEVHTGDDQVLIDGELEILNDRLVIFHIQEWDGNLDSGEDVTGQARLDGKSLPQVGSSKLGVSMGPDVVNIFSADCQGGITILPDSPVSLRLRIPSVTKIWDFAMGQIALPLQDCRMSDGGPANFFTQNPEDFNTRFNIGTFDFWYSLVGQDRDQLNMGPPLPHGANDTRTLLMAAIFDNSTLQSFKSATGLDFSDFSVKFPGTCSLTSYLATGHCEMHVDVHKLQFFHVNLTLSPRTHWDVSFNIHINRCYDHPFAPPRFDFGCYGSDCHLLLEPYHATPFFCQQDSDCQPNFDRTNGGAPAKCQLLNDFIDRPPIIFQTTEESDASQSACTRTIQYDTNQATLWTRESFEIAWAQAAKDAQCIIPPTEQLRANVASQSTLKVLSLAQLREEKQKQKQKHEKQTPISTSNGQVVATNQANVVTINNPGVTNIAVSSNTPTECLDQCQRGIDWWRKQFVWIKPFDGSGVAQVQEMPVIISNQVFSWGNDAVPFYLFEARMQAMYYCYDWDCGNGQPNTAPWGYALTQATYGYTQVPGCCVCDAGWQGNHCKTPPCNGFSCTDPAQPFAYLGPDGQCTCGIQCTRQDCGGHGDPIANTGYPANSSVYDRCQCSCDAGYSGLFDCYPSTCSLKCQNGGYPDPTCTYCICPPDQGLPQPFYGGRLCDQYACGIWTCNFHGHSNNSVILKDQKTPPSDMDTLTTEPHPECLPCHCDLGYIGTYCGQQPFLLLTTSTTSTTINNNNKYPMSFREQTQQHAQHLMKTRGLEGGADAGLMAEAEAKARARAGGGGYSYFTNETSPDWKLASLLFHSLEYQYQYSYNGETGTLVVPNTPAWLSSDNTLDCSGPQVPFCIDEQRFGWDCNTCDGSARATAHFLQWVNSAANNDFSSPPASSLNSGVTIGFCAPAIFNIDVNEPGNNQTAVDFVNGLKNGTVDGLVSGVFPCNASLTNHTVDAYGFSYACDCLPGYYDENNNLNCLPMPCDALPAAIPHGTYPETCLDVPTGTDCPMVCEDGYQPLYPPTCLFGEWGGVGLPECNPSNCDPLGELSGDRISGCADIQVPIGETCQLACAKGTTQQGETSPYLLCSANPGQPTSSYNTDQINAFVCQPNSCDVSSVNPPAAGSGGYVPPDVVPNNGKLDIQCNPGYVRNGGDYVCRYGQLTGESLPTCTPASCSPLPADLGNGRHASCSETDALLGSICTLSCDEGTLPYGNPNIGCVPIAACAGAAEWNSTAINLFSCSMRPCDISALAPPSGGSYFPSTTLAQGAQLYIVCNPGYLVNAGSALCEGGVLVGTLPTCAAAQCAPLPPLGDRLASCTTPQPLGSWCLLSCATGSTASGKANATCMGMGGSGSGIAEYDPVVLSGFTCSPNPCNVSGLLSNAAHGSYIPYAEALLPSGASLAITCNPGYTTVLGMAMCSHGQISGALPSCTPGFCAPLPHSLGADRFSSCSTPQPLGSSCQLSCTTGASANGDGVLPCIGIVGAAEYNTTIMNDFTCTPNPCTLSGNPKGGVYVPAPSIANNQAITVVCDPGYAVLAGNAVCHYGTIMGTLPACTPSSCSPLPQALGGDRLTDTACNSGPQTLGSICELSCASGSVASGDPKAYCVGVPGCNGAAQYNLTVLMRFTCTPNSCNISSLSPAKILGGHYAPYPDVANGVPVNAVCDDGYSATPAVMCNHGSLTGALPTCVPSQCQALHYFGVDTTTCGTASPGTTCVLTCLPGFHRIDWGAGTNVSALCTGVCAGQAAWKHDDFVCAPNDCTTLPVPPVGGSYPTCSCGTIRHLHACNLTCDPGYTHYGLDPLCVGGNLVNVNENGCTAAICPAIASPGLHACVPSPTGSVCNASCDAGYQRVNSADPAWENLDCKGNSTGTSVWTPRLNAITCAEKPCAAKSNPKGGFYNKECLQSVVPAGTICNLTCDSRFYNVVNPIAKCQLGDYTANQNCVDKAFSSSSAPWSSSPYSSSAPYSSSSVHGSNAFVLECGQQLTEVMDKFPLLSLSDTVTQNVLMKCHNPVNSSAPCDPLPVWGTYDYTLDSDICTAIRHVASSWDAEVWVTLTYQEMRPSNDRLQVFVPTLRNDVQTLPWVEAYPITFHLSENEVENPPPLELPAFREKPHHSHSSSPTKAASSRPTPLYRHTVNREYTATQLAEWRSRTAKGKPLSHYDRQLLITNKAASVASARTSGNTHRRDHLQPEVIDDNFVAPSSPSLLEIAFTHARHVRDYLTGRPSPAEATQPQASSPRASSQQSNQDQLQPSADPQQRFRNNRKT